jgi:hypothetical protein
MYAVRSFAVAVLACATAPLAAQEKQPPGIDRATAEAWKKRGFVAGWLRELDGRVALTPEYPKDGRAIPALWYGYSDRDPADDDLKDLPAVGVPFALSLAGRGKFTDAGLKHLGSLANLAWLDVGPAAITGEGLEPLAGLRHLTTLKVRHSSVMTAAGAKHLAALRHLKRLDLDGCTKFGDDGLKELAALTALTVLDLTHTPITDDGLRHLAKLTNLVELELGGTRVTDEGLKHLAGLKNLTTLGLVMTEVAGENLKHLAGLKKLTLFNVENGKLTDTLLRNLDELGMLHTLFQAEAYGEEHGDREGDVRPTRPEDVRTFRLICREGTGEGVKYLACFPNLDYLFLGTEQVTRDGLKYAAGLKSLTSLGLESTEHMRDGLKYLAGLKKLASLRIGGTELSRDNLKHALAVASVTRLDVPVADQTLGVLHEAGALHRLLRATTANGKRATTDDEVVALDLSYCPLTTGEGLKHVAKLKNIASIDLRGTRITREWEDDFRRTRPKCRIVK